MKDKNGRKEDLARELSKANKKIRELQEWEDRYKALFDRSLYCVYVHDLKGNFLDANKAALDLLGYKKKEIKTLNFASLLDENQMPQAYERLSEIAITGFQKKSSQFRLKKKDGDYIWVETEASLLYKEGVPYGIMGIARDITEHRNAEAALRKSEEKYRKIFESLHDVYYLTDKDGIITEISPSVTKQAGWDPGDVIGHPVTDFYLDPSSRETFTKILKEEGAVNDYELQLLAKDGTVIDVSVNSRIVLDQDCQPVGVEGVLRNIAVRKKMEKALRESEEKFRTMVELSLQGIFIVQDMRLVYANEAISQITGFSMEELHSLPPDKLQGIVHPEDKKLVWGRLADRLAGKEVPSRYEFRTIRKDGETVWLEMISSRIEFEGKPAIQGAVIDISDRQQADEKTKASLKEKEVMLREIHHRVKNNMQIILSLLRIQSRAVKDRETREMFKQSQNRIRSMALIHEALYKSGDLAHIDIADYISRMTTHLLSIYREDLGEVEIEQDAGGIFLDINRAIPCGLMISELVSNSLKHAFPEKRGGHILIRMTKSEKGKTTLIVKDNGIGFPAGLDFRKTDTLGLQLVTDLVMQINGTIQIKKTEGTEFVVKF